MDIHASQTPSGASSAYPGWVMLKHYGEQEDESSCFNADAKTLAAARTTTGHLIHVGFSVQQPPAVSQLCYHFPETETIDATVMASHGDSVLIEINFCIYRLYDDDTINYFVYNAGGGAAAAPLRPPTLTLLTPYHLTDQEKKRYSPLSEGPTPMQRPLHTEATGLLRRGVDELVVAELKIVTMETIGKPARRAAELLVLRRDEWSVMRPPVIRITDGEGDSGGGALPSSWTTDIVVPVNDELLCWVDLINGVTFCDVFDECPSLRYLPLPVTSYFGRASYRNVCATAGGGALKFVDIFPRCCCGGAGATYCKQSHHAYTIRTWILRIDDDNMEWVMDGVVDATELWALDAYNGIPRVRLEQPVVSLDDPHTICFVVDHGGKVWLIMLDMRSKTLQSVYRHVEGRIELFGPESILIPSKVSDYLNSCPSSSNGDTSSSSQPPQRNDVNNRMQSSSKSPAEPEQQSAILGVLEEVPGLARDDMLKAYSILCNGNGRRFKNLLGLPIHLRKDWLLMEIKASDACFFCSTCAADLQRA